MISCPTRWLLPSNLALGSICPATECFEEIFPTISVPLGDKASATF